MSTVHLLSFAQLMKSLIDIYLHIGPYTNVYEETSFICIVCVYIRHVLYDNNQSD